MIDDDEAEAEEYQPPRVWSWWRFGAVVTKFVANGARSVQCLWDDMATMLGEHAEVGDDRRRAYEVMHRDLESLPTTEG